MIASIQAATGETTGGKSSGLGQTLTSAALKARAQAQTARAAAGQAAAVESTDASYLNASLQRAVASGDMEVRKEGGEEAISAVEKVSRQRRKRNSAQAASGALQSSGNALAQNGDLLTQASEQAAGQGETGSQSVQGMENVINGLTKTSE